MKRIVKHRAGGRRRKGEEEGDRKEVWGGGVGRKSVRR